MSAEGVTPGPWIVHQKPSGAREYGHHVIAEGGLTVCHVTYQLPALVGSEVVERERIANAILIAEAGTVLHETRKTPRQLADEVEQARRTADYWKAEHLVANAEVERLKRERSVLIDGVRHANKSCPCGARGESPATHPHVPGCAVGIALELAEQQQTAGGQQ